MNDKPSGPWRADQQPPFADFMGMKVTHVSPERVTAEMVVTEQLSNLGPGQITTTIESKTNFFAGIPKGETAYAECTPLHRGRTTTVWQTRVTRKDGKLAALVTQTQLMMTKKS
jgi:1,4-dihydroxy-2-naphthoyl-CoA hydrolase